MRKITLFMGLVFVFWGCQEVYDIPPQSQVQINFYGVDEEEEVSSKSILLSIKGVDSDSVWVSAVKTNSFVLPLGNSGVDTFELMMDSVVDQLRITYTPILNYESMSTGFYYDYHIKSVEFTSNKINEVYLIDTLVIDTAHENIQLLLNNNTGFTSN
ncbi:MAG: DUF6452 family protein [Mangrovibacterium sp.]